ncbi:MAG: cell division protein FtsA [Candidatus Eisenbacteria bacterium]|nr:cell division protein FtsA [Candidatus Eisenbacteria bacterium]
MRRSEILVGLDLGSSRVKVVVADTADRELPEVLGVGEADSLGIEAGVIVNMERAALSIRSAVEAAEESAEVDIGRVLVTLDGEHIKGIDSRGVVAASRSGGEIAKPEVNAVLDAAKTLALPVGRTILDARPQEFFVDGQRGIRDPIGMSGVRLGCKVHIVTASQQSVDNVVRAVRRAGLKLSGMSFKSLAAGTAVLSEDEKELGVLLVNLGAGTTGLVLYHGGAVRHTAAIGWGAASITSDIAVGLRMPIAKAEQLKREWGCASASLAEDTPIRIPTVGGHPPRESSGQILATIIEPRVREILEMVMNEVSSTDYWGRIPAGVVLTGGGARLREISSVAEEVFGVGARIGLPDRVSGHFDAIVDPAHAAAVGMVMSATDHEAARPRPDKPFAETVQRVRQWVDSLL